MPDVPPDWAVRALAVAPDAVLVLDGDGLVHEANPAAEAIFGLGRDEIAGRPVGTLIVDPPMRVGALPAVVAGVPARARSGDGTEQPVELTVVEIPGSSPVRAAFIRQRFEASHRNESAARTERLLAGAQELAQVGSWEFDLQTRSTTWSPVMSVILGVEPGLGAQDQEVLLGFIHSQDQENVRQMLQAIAEGADAIPDEGVTGEIRVVRPDGAVRNVRAQGRVERDPEGRAIRWVGVAQDVTLQRVREHELQAHYAVSQALRQWKDYREGIMDLLRRMGTALHHPMGSLWQWDDGADGLTCRGFWHAPDVDPRGFDLAKRRLVFKPGEGKPGVAWATQEPVVTPDASTDPVFQPQDAAIIRGISSGIAFPAVGEHGPVCVLSYYSFERVVASPSLVRTLAVIGRELGRFLEARPSDLDASPLSGREVEVMRLAADGHSGPRIAEELYLSPATVKTHFEHIYEKLGVSDRAAAVAQALRSGVIS